MNKEVYKHRTGVGMATYNIISGVFGVDSTLHLRDTSCTHSGPKCEIEVTMCDNGKCYQFSKALNWTAETHIEFHRIEKFWATKEEAYVEALEISADSYRGYIADDDKRIEGISKKLEGMVKKSVHRASPKDIKLGASCFIKDAGDCRIIGVISFEDGKVGYLTDSNYNDDDWYDSYDGDRIILVEADGRIVTERGDIVYKSRTDYENHKKNEEIDKQTELLSNYKRHLEQHIKTLRKINDIIGSKDTLTFEQMFEMRNGK